MYDFNIEEIIQAIKNERIPIVSVTRVELKEGNECPLCLFMDGTTFSIDDLENINNWLRDLHPHCWWTPVFNFEGTSMATYYNYREPPEDLMKHYHPYYEDTDAIEWAKAIMDANEQLQRELQLDELTEEEKEVVAKELIRNMSTDKISSGTNYAKLGQKSYNNAIKTMNEIQEEIIQNMEDMHKSGLFKSLSARQIGSLVKQSRWFKELLKKYDISETELLDKLRKMGIIEYYETLENIGDIYGF